MKTKTKGLIALIVVIVAAIYYYVTIPAINIHSTDTWGAVLFLIVIALIVKLFFYGFRNPAKIRISDLKESKITPGRRDTFACAWCSLFHWKYFIFPDC